MITGRAAARGLAGLVGSDEQARVLLRAGVCGPGQRSGSVLLYDDARVLALAQRPHVDHRDLPDSCPNGLYVARLSRTLALDVSLSWQQVTDQVRLCPAIPWLTSALLGVRIAAAKQNGQHGGRPGGLPWVATLCGFVVHGGDLMGIDEPEGGPARFQIEPPGDWFTRLDNHWFQTGAGGRSWWIWDPPIPIPPRRRVSRVRNDPRRSRNGAR